MIYIFILRRRRFCVVGIQSERVRTYLSYVAGTFLWSNATAGEHTREADRSAWVTSGSLPSLDRPADLSPLCLSDQRISAFSPKLPTLYCLFKSPAEVCTSSSPNVFFCLWLVIGTYILPFCFVFPVICWSYMWTEISVTLSIGDELYSHHHILYFSFLWKPLCWCYLATALNLLSSSMSLCR